MTHLIKQSDKEYEYKFIFSMTVVSVSCVPE
jgi:hypothetical protein